MLALEDSIWWDRLFSSMRERQGFHLPDSLTLLWAKLLLFGSYCHLEALAVQGGSFWKIPTFTPNFHNFCANNF